MIDPRKIGEWLMGQYEATRQPLKERGSILPIGEYADGSVHPAIPGLLMAPYEGMKNFGRYGYGENAVEDNARNAFDATGAALTGGLAAAGAGMVDNAVGIFGGRLAKTADQAALKRAEELAASGAPREQIWNETGWFQGPDQKWRFEIDDSQMSHEVPIAKWIDRQNGTLMAPNLGAAYSEAASQLTPNAPVRMKRLFKHDDLKRAYPLGFTKSMDHPDIMGMETRLIEQGGQTAGFFDPENKFMALNEALVPNEAKSTALHELQHVIQRHEGFAKGGSVGSVGPNALGYTPDHAVLEQAGLIKSLGDQWPGGIEGYLKDFPDRLPDGTEYQTAALALAKDPEKLSRAWTVYNVNTDPVRAYQHLAGEAEARLVQKRMDMKPDERRARPPWLDYDVPESDQIIRANAKTGAAVPLGMETQQNTDLDPALLQVLRQNGMLP